MTKHFKRPLSVLLAVLMIAGIFVTVPMTASAWDDNPYAELVNTTTTVKFNGLDWYVIEDNSTAVNAGTITLLAKDPFCAKQFDASSSAYSTSAVKTYLDGLTTGTGSFADVANAIKTVQVKGSDSDSAVDAKLYLLSVAEATPLRTTILKCAQAEGAAINRWWLRTSNGNAVAFVGGDNSVIRADGAGVASMYEVRPALQLDLSAVNLSAVRLSGGTGATVSGGSISQYYFEVGSTQNAMTTVTYTAKTDCMFPATSEYYTTTNGITVTRTSDTVVTVSGTPEGVANIVVPNAKKPQIITASDVTVAYGAVGKCVVGTTNGEGGITYTVKSGNAVTVNETSGELTTRNVGTAVITITAAETSACLKATKDVTVTVTAEQTPPDPSSGAYADLVNTTTSVKFNGIAWYIIKDDSTAVDAGTVTLLAKDPIGVSAFNENQSDGNAYSGSTVEAYLNSLTSAGGSFEAVKDAIIDSKLNLLSLDEANAIKNANIYLLECISPAGTTSNLNYYWLSNPGNSNNSAVYVGGDHGAIKADGASVDKVFGVRPVLKLDLSKVTFSTVSVNITGGANATTRGGSASQKFFESDSTTHSAIVPVTYTAGVCCTFPATSEYYTTTNGITVERIDDKTVKVSGTPTTDDVNISVPNAIPDHDLHCYATGATLTAYCPTAKCPMRENKTPAIMTIVAPTTSSEATLTDLEAFNIATGLSVSTNDIKYYKATKNGDEYTKGEALTAAPTAAGDYVAEITVSGVKNRDNEPNQSVTASVGYTIESSPYESLVCNDKATVMFNGMAWYVIEDNSTAENAGTLTLFARDPLCASVFNNGNRYTDNIDQYSNSVVRNYLDGLTTGSGSFAGVADAIVPVDLTDVNVAGAKIWLLSLNQAQTIFDTNKFVLICTKANGVTDGLNYCWTRTKTVGSPDGQDNKIRNNTLGFFAGDNGKVKGSVNGSGMQAYKSGNVRPALQLDLSKVTLSPVTVTLSGGANAETTGGGTTQRFLEVDSSTRSPIETVYYRGGTCCTFPATSEYYTTTDGITVEYVDSKTLKVSGTPTKDDVNITIPDAIANHNFTYSASGATITAGCKTSGCPARSSFKPLKLTIEAPTTDTEATLTNLAAFNSATNLSISTNDIKYYNATKSGDTYTKNGDALTGAPSSAGDYLAEITVSGATASVGYTIDIPEGINYSGDNYIKQDDKVQVSDSDEGKNNFGLGYTEYLNMQMLGIQKKSAIATQGGDDGIRFVTAVNTNLLKGEKIEDYGYIVVKAKAGTSVDKIYENMDKLTYDKVGANNRFTCKGTSNTISGDFGKYDTNTDYKYVTLSLTGTSGSTDTIAARFYIKTTDGNYYYADYIDGNNVTHRGMAFTLPIA